jgi:hypothetical protein
VVAESISVSNAGASAIIYSFVDLRDHYFAHRSWFFGFVLAGVFFSAAKELALNGHLPGRMNGEFHVIFGLAAIVAAGRVGPRRRSPTEPICRSGGPALLSSV